MASFVEKGTLFSSFPSIKVELEQIAEYCTNRAEYCHRSRGSRVAANS